MPKSVMRIGDWVEDYELMVVNRTGGALVVGTIYKLDVAGTDGDVNTYATYIADTTPDPKASPLANIIAVGANTADESGIFVVALATTANDEVGRVKLAGLVKVLATAGDGSSDAITAGEVIQAVASAGTASKYATGLGAVGLALESGDTAAATKLIWCIFDGRAYNAPNVGTV